MKKLFGLIVAFLLASIPAAYANTSGIVKISHKNGNTYEGKADVSTNARGYNVVVQYQGNNVIIPTKNIKSILFTNTERPQNIVITLQNGTKYEATSRNVVINYVDIAHDLGKMNIRWEDILEIAFIDVK